MKCFLGRNMEGSGILQIDIFNSVATYNSPFIWIHWHLSGDLSQNKYILWLRLRFKANNYSVRSTHLEFVCSLNGSLDSINTAQFFVVSTAYNFQYLIQLSPQRMHFSFDLTKVYHIIISSVNLFFGFFFTFFAEFYVFLNVFRLF